MVQPLSLSLSLSLYIYICVCVCVFMRGKKLKGKEKESQRLGKSKLFPSCNESWRYSTSPSSLPPSPTFMSPSIEHDSSISSLGWRASAVTTLSCAFQLACSSELTVLLSSFHTKILPSSEPEITSSSVLEKQLSTRKSLFLCPRYAHSSSPLVLEARATAKTHRVF